MDIVCVAFPAFEGDYVKSTVELMRQMANRHRVLYVDYAYTWNDLIGGLLGKKKEVPAKKMLGLLPRLTTQQNESGNDIYVLTPPPILPLNFLKNKTMYGFLGKINGWLMQRTIRQAMKSLGIQNPFVINAFNPFFGETLVNKLNEKKRLYYCYDEISACMWAKNHGGRLEQAFIPQNHAVVVSSQGLYQSKKALAKNCFIVQNGVDARFFDVKTEDRNSSQQLGYIGSIDSRLDYTLLVKLATQNPDKELVMVGRIVADQPIVKAGITKLRSLPNVRFEGAKSPQELVGYMAHFSVGLIPFVKNEQTKAIYPMKINEYLAAGLPVVSTDFAPLSEFEGVVAFGKDLNHFCQLVTQELANNSTQKQAKRVDFARQNTWQRHAIELENLLLSI
jgi:glycosyltransferase involved in cell wall biosynthesis